MAMLIYKCMKMFLANKLNKLQLSHIIFDFDKTLYSSKNINNEYLNYICTAIINMCDVNKKTARDRMKNAGFVKYNKNMSRMRDSSAKLGFSIEDWDKYRKKNFFYPKENIVSVDNNLLKKIKKKYHTYIVTTETYKNLVIKSKNYQIDLNNFHKIYASEYNGIANIEKTTIYQKIINEANVSPSRFLVIGDRYVVDLVPLLNLGGSAILIKNVKEVNKILLKLLKV